MRHDCEQYLHVHKDGGRKREQKKNHTVNSHTLEWVMWPICGLWWLASHASTYKQIKCKVSSQRVALSLFFPFLCVMIAFFLSFFLALLACLSFFLANSSRYKPRVKSPPPSVAALKLKGNESAFKRVRYMKRKPFQGRGQGTKGWKEKMKKTRMGQSSHTHTSEWCDGLVRHECRPY